MDKLEGTDLFNTEHEYCMDIQRLKWQLTINQCHLADVRDARAELTQQWDSLQEARKVIMSKLIELEKIEE